MKVVAYYRRSTDLQDHSIQMQRQKAFQKSVQLGINITEEIEDDAVSGRKTSMEHRPGLQKIIEGIKQRQISVIFVYKRDRLARKAFEYLKLYELFKEYKVKLIFTADQEFPLFYTPQAVFFEAIFAAMIEKEADTIVERLKAALESSFLEGKYPGRLPTGYSFDNATGSIVLDSSKLNVIKTMYNKLLNNESLQDIIIYATEQLPERKWTSSTVRKLLQNPSYMGLRILNIEGLPTRYKEFASMAIIEEHDWTSAQKILSGTKKQLKHIRIHVDFFLNGFLKCKTCNILLQGKTRRKKNDQISSYYFCPLCHNRIPKEEIESLVLRASNDYLRSLFSSKHYLRLNQQFVRKNIEDIQKRIQKIESHIQSINNQIIKRTKHLISSSISSIESQKLEHEIIDLQKKNENFEKEKNNLLKEIESLQYSNRILDEISKEFQNANKKLNQDQVFKNVIDKILVDKYYLNISFKSPFEGIKQVHNF